MKLTKYEGSTVDLCIELLKKKKEPIYERRK